MDLVPFPERTPKQLREAFDTTMRDALKVGLTSIHDASGEDENVQFYKRCPIWYLCCTSQLTRCFSVAESGDLPVWSPYFDQPFADNVVASSELNACWPS